MEIEAQSSNSVLLVRPASFGFHAEAAASTAFAKQPRGEIGSKALREFDGLAERLTNAGVHVLILEDTSAASKPVSSAILFAL